MKSKKVNVEDLDRKIKEAEEARSLFLVKSLSSRKCESCGCYDGVHKSDCYLMNKFW